MGSIGERAAFAKPKELRAAIQQTLGQENLSPDSYFVVAEMMKRLGDYRASSYYEKAIQADPDEPCYESFYADYLRNFRGEERRCFHLPRDTISGDSGRFNCETAPVIGTPTKK